MLGTQPITGSESVVKSKSPPQMRQIGVCETKGKTELTDEITLEITS